MPQGLLADGEQQILDDYLVTATRRGPDDPGVGGPAYSSGMSVNIDLAFTVTRVADEPQAWAIVRALQELMYEEDIADQVTIGVAVDDGGSYFVSGDSDFPLGISRFYLWQPHFEGVFASTVAAVAAGAEPEVRWGYPDEEY
ncbi:hypothetical protein ACGFNX_29690 [Streptomyces sp. NPDC048723]|uniref:hypothetical protein n=1 Tax=unclassified Streptomyces TaxID=2593676 RepID=UPI0035636FD5